MYHGTNVNFTLFSTGGPLSRASSRYDKNKHSYVSSSKGYSSSTGTEIIVHVGGCIIYSVCGWTAQSKPYEWVKETKLR